MILILIEYSTYPFLTFCNVLHLTIACSVVINSVAVCRLSGFGYAQTQALLLDQLAVASLGHCGGDWGHLELRGALKLLLLISHSLDNVHRVAHFSTSSCLVFQPRVHA